MLFDSIVLERDCGFLDLYFNIANTTFKTNTMNRRTFLQNTSVLAPAAAIAPLASFNIINRTSSKNEIVVGHGSHRYRVIKDWAKISTVHTPLLNCHEMVMDRKGRLLMLGDHTQNNILVFDKSGVLLDAWGTQYPGGHGLTLAKEGEEDNLFIVDCGWFQGRTGKWETQAGRVAKTTIDGRLIFNVGHPATMGIYAEDEPFMPTEVAVAPNGDFYIADGYGSDYILQYNHKGEFIRRFGGENNENKDYNLNNAHGIAVDNRDPAQPKLIVTCRADNAFKYFTLDGQYIKTVPLPGAFVCRPVMDDSNVYAGVCWSLAEDGKRYPNSGFVTILDENDRVVSNPGGAAPVYQGGQLQPLMQADGKEKVFHHGHDVCVDDDKNLYVCQWNANKTPPVKLERIG